MRGKIPSVIIGRRATSESRPSCFTHDIRALRSVSDGIDQRLARAPTGLNQDDASIEDEENPLGYISSIIASLLSDRQASSVFRISEDSATLSDFYGKASLGLPENCIVKPKDEFLLIKPQIAWRSDFDKDSIILFAVDEISSLGFKVIDRDEQDSVTADVLTR